MGLFEKLKGLINKGTEQMVESGSAFNDVIEQLIAEQLTSANHVYSISFPLLPTYRENISKWDDIQKGSFIIFLCTLKKPHIITKNDPDENFYQRSMVASQLIEFLLKSKLNLTEEQLATIYAAFKSNVPDREYLGMFIWPLAHYLKQIEHNYPSGELPETILAVLDDMTRLTKNKGSYYYKDQIKLTEKIKAFLYKAQNPEGAVQPAYFIGNDAFSEFANQMVMGLKEEEKTTWYKLIAIAQKTTGSKPNKKFQDTCKEWIDELGHDKFKRVTHEWFQFLIDLKETVETEIVMHDGRGYQLNTTTYLDSLNADALKTFVWMMSWFHDQTSIQTMSKLAERCFRKIPGKGPAAAAIGNACLYTLYASRGMDGLAQLTKLKFKIKQTATTALIEKYLAEAAKKLGLSPDEVEDIAADDFKLQEHRIVRQFDDITGILQITGIGKSTLRWFKKDGSEQKSVPQSVKVTYADKLKKLKDKQKQIDSATSVQKERFDRMLRSNRTMTRQYFAEKYIQHGLISYVINNVIFTLSNAHGSITALYHDQQWIGLRQEEIDFADYDTIGLWHPANSTTEEVLSWRTFLMERKIVQPFKQAYREIYIVTDAEIATGTYSNRMASHILKQHQYVTLAKGRNWKAKLIGAWEGGDQDIAELLLPEHNLRVEYRVNAVQDENQFNATGIWNYVSTDQVRFLKTDTHELVELINVPPIVFSEVMRDVDLFVGVASVGNDPTWSDSGGLPNHREYWNSYSFGNLSEIAKNRKEILEGLIPRLKIASVSRVDGNYVIVKGKLRTYKIHIGSTNILMEPNDQYLCIVADRPKTDKTENLYLPFEGDSSLSVIISKALLLAADDKITDTTITSQINRR